MTAELEQLRKDNERLASERDSMAEDASRQRRERAEQVSRLQGEVDRLNAENTSSEATVSALRERINSQTIKYEEALGKIKEQQDRLIIQEEEFSKDLAMARHLKDLHEEAANDCKRRLEQVEQLWNDEEKSVEARLDDLRQQIHQEQQLREQVEQRLTASESDNEDLRRQLATANFVMGSKTPNKSKGVAPATPETRSNGSPTILSPSAAVAARLQKSGRSFTEIYTEYTQLQRDFAAAERENEDLRQQLDQIMQTVEESAPLLEERHWEIERLKADHERTSQQLAIAVKERDDVKRKSQDSVLAAERLEREGNAYQQEIRDLSLQLQHLLKGIQERDNGQISAGLDTSITITEESDVIANQFVSFHNIVDLQQQNQRLIRLTRDLSQQLESSRSQPSRDIDSEAMEQADSLINDLQAQLKSMRVKMDSYINERDMYRRMVEQVSKFGSSHSIGSNDTSSMQDWHKMYTELQANFDAYRQEMGTDSRILKEQLLEAQREKGQLEIAVAKANNQVQFTNERYKLLSENTEMQSREAQELERRNQSLQEQVMKQEIATQRISEDLLSTQSTADRLRNETSNLKAEKQLWKSIEARLVSENKDLMQERVTLNELNLNLQAMQGELERSEADAKRRLQQQLEDVESDVKDVKSRLAEAESELRHANLRKELDAKDYQTKIDKLTSDYHTSREQTVEAKTRAESLQSKVDDLTRQLAAKDDRLAIYEKKSVDTTGSSINREQQREIELADVRRQLAEAQGEVESAKEHVEQYMAIARANEDAMAELNSTHEQYVTNMDREVAEKDSEVANLQERLAQLNNELTKTGEEVSNLHSQLENQRTAHIQDKQHLEDRVTQLQQAAEQARSAQEFAQEDSQRQAKIAQEAQNSYETELMKHGEDVQRLHALKEQQASIEADIRKYQTEAETARANLAASQDSWDKLRQNYEKELEEVRRRCEDLSSQNKVLHQHLDTVTSQATQIKERSALDTAAILSISEAQEAEGANNQATANDKAVQDLREVIKFMRREQRMSEMQLELSKTDIRRLKQQLEQTTQNLEEARSVLSEERSRDAVSLQTAAQHSELMDKINQLSILRESNSTLREENERNVQRVRQLEAEVLSLQQTLAPLQEQISALQVEVQVREGQQKLLEEDNQRWKARTQQIFANHEKVDPAEIENLKKEVETLRGDLDQRNRDLEAKDAQRKEMVAKSNDISSRMKGRLDAARTELQTVKDELQNVKSSLASKDEEMSAKDSEIQRLTNELASKESSGDATMGEAPAVDVQELTQERDALKEEKTKLGQERDQIKSKFEKLQGQARNMLTRLKAAEAENKQLKEASPNETASEPVDVQAKINEAENQWKEAHTAEIQDAVDAAVAAKTREFEEANAEAIATAAAAVAADMQTAQEGNSTPNNEAELEKLRAQIATMQAAHQKEVNQTRIEAHKQATARAEAKAASAAQAQIQAQNAGNTSGPDLAKLKEEHETAVAAAVAAKEAELREQMAQIEVSARQEAESRNKVKLSMADRKLKQLEAKLAQYEGTATSAATTASNPAAINTADANATSGQAQSAATPATPTTPTSANAGKPVPAIGRGQAMRARGARGGLRGTRGAATAGAGRGAANGGKQANQATSPDGPPPKKVATEAKVDASNGPAPGKRTLSTADPATPKPNVVNLKRRKPNEGEGGESSKPAPVQIGNPDNSSS